MYNSLEKLRSGEPLPAKEKKVHEQGLVSVLAQIHDDLDAAVFDAYVWPHDLTDEEILERLVALNAERQPRSGAASSAGCARNSRIPLAPRRRRRPRLPWSRPPPPRSGRKRASGVAEGVARPGQRRARPLHHLPTRPRQLHRPGSRPRLQRRQTRSPLSSKPSHRSASPPLVRNTRRPPLARGGSAQSL